MSGRGRRAALPPGDHARPEVVSGDGLVVDHRNRDGRVAVYDFATLPVAEPVQRSLATLFARRCVPGRWEAHGTSNGVWHSVLAFATFLSTLERPVNVLENVTAAHLKRWRLQLGAGGASYNRHNHIASLLRDNEHFQAGPVAEELARRFAKPASKVQSYPQADFDRMRTAAAREFRAALLRIRENAVHLDAWRRGSFTEGSREFVVGEALDVLARTGDVPRRTNGVGKLVLVARYRTALGGAGAERTWGRLFLTSREAAALGVLLLANFGWNLSVIDTAEVPLALPDQGEDGHPVYRIPVEKFKRGARQHFETRNVADDGAASKGRLITEALEATRFARALVEQMAPGTSRLLVWRTGIRTPQKPSNSLDRLAPVGPFHFGVQSKQGTEWAGRYGFGGSPFQRGRRTVLVVDRREPTQHSQDTHDRSYALVDKQVQDSAVSVIAEGATEAADRARTAVLQARVVAAPIPGDIATAIADCEDMAAGPFPAPDGGCAASFLMCLGCGNAHVHPGHHPRLAFLHTSLVSMRSVLPHEVWDSEWSDTHARLEDLKHKVGAASWSAALTRASTDDREMIGLLLTGDLNS